MNKFCALKVLVLIISHVGFVNFIEMMLEDKLLYDSFSRIVFSVLISVPSTGPQIVK
jgi:hypothetical protein